MIQNNLLAHCTRRWRKLLNRLHHICKWTDLCNRGLFLAKSNTVQNQSAFEQLDAKGRINSLWASYRACSRHMTLIGSMEHINGFQSFLYAAVSIIGSIAIRLS